MKKSSDINLLYVFLALPSHLIAMPGYAYIHKLFSLENLFGLLTRLGQIFVASLVVTLAGGIVRRRNGFAMEASFAKDPDFVRHSDKKYTNEVWQKLNRLLGQPYPPKTTSSYASFLRLPDRYSR